LDLDKVKKQAQEEYEEELFRDEVEKYKNKLRQKRSLWDKVFPYKILFVKKGGLL
jgi:hypothetical protein